MNQVDFFSAVLAAGYGANSGRIEYEYQKIRRSSLSKSIKINTLKNSERRLAVFISKMKHDGLIEADKDKFKISDKGKSKLGMLRNSLPGRFYERTEEGNAVIISFDIPERLRRKRNWLREVIRNFGFQMIHQSVWMGKGGVPKDFIEDLENLKILEFVEIFEVSKQGSLRKVT